MTQFSVVYTPIVRYDVYIVQHEDNEEALDVFEAWNSRYKVELDSKVTPIGRVDEENSVGLETTVEGTFNTYEDAAESDEALAG